MNKNDFPIFKNNPGLVYLDSGATAQKPQIVIDRLKKYYEFENANVHRGIYKLSEKSTEEYEKARDIIKRYINAHSEKEIIFTGGATDSMNFVAYSWVLKNLKEGDTLMATQMEHHSNLIPWQQIMMKKKNCGFELVRVTPEFTLDLEDLEKKLKKNKPKLFAFTHVSNVLGTINPVKQIVEIKDEVSPNTRILLDTAQGIPHLPIDVQDMGIDFLAFSGHKVYGPTGIGILWAKEEILENEMDPFRYGGGMIREVEADHSVWADLPERYEAGTPNIADAVGLSEALKYISNIGIEQIQEYESKVCRYAQEKLEELEGVKIFGPKNFQKRQGVFSFIIDGVHPHDVAQILSDNNIAVRAGHHCCQVLMRDVLKVAATTRASFGIYNDESDVDKLIEGIKEVIRIFK